MELQISEHQDSIQVSKSSVGYGFITKIYKKEDDNYTDVVKRLKKTHTILCLWIFTCLE